MSFDIEFEIAQTRCTTATGLAGECQKQCKNCFICDESKVHSLAIKLTQLGTQKSKTKYRCDPDSPVIGFITTRKAVSTEIQRWL
jgi:hypothetical protein